MLLLSIWVCLLLSVSLNPSCALPCATCGGGMGMGPMRGEGLVGGARGPAGTMQQPPPAAGGAQNGWSTSWTQRPWSWSRGAGRSGDNGGMDSATHPWRSSGGGGGGGGMFPAQTDSDNDDFASFGWNGGSSLRQQRPPPPSAFGGGPGPSAPPSRQSFMQQMQEEAVEPQVPALPFGYLSEEARDAMLHSCQSGAVDCKSQPFGMMQKRTMVVQHEMDFMRKARPYSSGEMVERRVDMVYQLKLKMLRVAGLGDHVQPVNDGTFEHDVLLTEQQSAELMDALNGVPAPHQAKKYGYGHGAARWRRAALFLEQMSVQRWPQGQPILYFFDASVQEYERQMVRQAHQMIEAQTCIRFQAAETKPQTDYLYYVKVATPTFCGLSYIGRVSPANPIYLSFQCQDPVGVATHETMHALGANHEHLRADRDEHISVQWANINPQFYDFFAIADPSKFTPYGVPYAFDSIMHYGAFTAALDGSKPTMVPLEDGPQSQALMGQRKRLSQRDVELLNAMHCKPGCEDRNVYCGVWALRNFCFSAPQMGWMRLNCQKSCKLC